MGKEALFLSSKIKETAIVLSTIERRLPATGACVLIDIPEGSSVDITPLFPDEDREWGSRKSHFAVPVKTWAFIVRPYGPILPPTVGDVREPERFAHVLWISEDSTTRLVKITSFHRQDTFVVDGIHYEPTHGESSGHDVAGEHILYSDVTGVGQRFCELAQVASIHISFTHQVPLSSFPIGVIPARIEISTQ